jgi:hypothetical protein
MALRIEWKLRNFVFDHIYLSHGLWLPDLGANIVVNELLYLCTIDIPPSKMQSSEIVLAELCDDQRGVISRTLRLSINSFESLI